MRNTNSSTVPIEIACHSDGIRKCRIGFKVLNATSCVYFSSAAVSKAGVYTFISICCKNVCTHAWMCLSPLCLKHIFFQLQALKNMFTSKENDGMFFVFCSFCLKKVKFVLDFLLCFQTTHHVYEALWKCGDADYTNIQNRPIPPAPNSHG